MDNLDEIILSKSENGFGFCNKKGIQILENIEKLLQQSVDQSKQIDLQTEEILNG
jgi:hypothetical protein